MNKFKSLCMVAVRNDFWTMFILLRVSNHFIFDITNVIVLSIHLGLLFLVRYIYLFLILLSYNYERYCMIIVLFTLYLLIFVADACLNFT